MTEKVFYKVEIVFKGSKAGLNIPRVSQKDLNTLMNNFEDGNQPIIEINRDDSTRLKINMKEIQAIGAKKLKSDKPEEARD